MVAADAFYANAAVTRVQVEVRLAGDAELDADALKAKAPAISWLAMKSQLDAVLRPVRLNSQIVVDLPAMAGHSRDHLLAGPNRDFNVTIVRIHNNLRCAADRIGVFP